MDALSELSANPFKGPKPYELGDHFYGRDNEILELYRAVENNSLTLLYAKSGIGKTSLLSAGFMPVLKETKHFYPFYFRIGNFLDFSSVGNLSEYIVRDIISQLDNDKTIKYTLGSENKSSLFALLSSVKIQAVAESHETPLIPIIILDQLEVIFTLDLEKGNVHELIDELHYLLDSVIPPYLSDLLTKENREKYLPLYDSIKSKLKPYRVVFSFREEYLFDFESLSDKISAIQFSSYRLHLKPFKRSVADEVIQKISTVNEVQEIPLEKANTITSHLLPNQRGNFLMQEIDPFLLSVVCHTLWESRKLEIVKSMVDNALQQYVSNIYGLISPATQKFIEDFLVTSNKKRTVYSYVLAIIEADQKEIDFLIDDDKSRLLSKEIYLDSYHIQIIHDRLVDFIFNKKSDREKENKLKEQERLLIAQRKQQEDFENKVRQLNREQTKSLWLSLTLFGFFLAILILGIFLFRNAEQKERINRMFANISLLNADKAYRDRNHDLAFNTALELDNLGSTHLRDSLVEGKKKWELSEYSGKKVNASEDKKWIACLQTNQQLEIYYLQDSVKSRNPHWTIESVSGFWMRDNHVAVIDTARKIITVYELNSLPSVERIWSGKVERPLYPPGIIITKEYIALMQSKKNLSRDSAEIFIYHFAGGRKDSIPANVNVLLSAGTKNDLYLENSDMSLVKCDIKRKVMETMQNAFFVGSNNKFIVRGKNRMLHKIEFDTILPVAIIKDINYELIDAFESKHHWALTFESYNDSLASESWFGIVTKNFIPRGETKILRYGNLSTGIGLVVMKENPILIRKDSLFEYSLNGIKGMKIVGNVSNVEMMNQRIVASESKIYVGGVGVIELTPTPRYVPVQIRYSTTSDFVWPLGALDLYYNDYAFVRNKPGLKKNLDYWKMNFEVNLDTKILKQ